MGTRDGSGGCDDGGAIAVGIMCKPPRPGLSKTRLTPAVGPEAAARLSAAFLADVGDSIARAMVEAAGTPMDGEGAGRVQGWGVYTPADAEREVRTLLPASFRFAVQHGETFDAVVGNAIADLLVAHPAGAMLVNGDSPTLPAATIVDAARALRAPGDRMVIGPARDGGYYLVGLKAVHRELFEDITWSTPVVLAETLARADAIGLPVVRLPEWYDVDDAESFGWLRDELASAEPSVNGSATPGARTRALLLDLGYLAAGSGSERRRVK